MDLQLFEPHLFRNARTSGHLFLGNFVIDLKVQNVIILQNLVKQCFFDMCEQGRKNSEHEQLLPELSAHLPLVRQTCPVTQNGVVLEGKLPSL